jgi:hypothetical protein
VSGIALFLGLRHWADDRSIVARAGRSRLARSDDIARRPIEGHRIRRLRVVVADDHPLSREGVV